MPMEIKVTGQLGSLHGIMAEFDDPESLLEAVPAKPQDEQFATKAPSLAPH